MSVAIAKPPRSTRLKPKSARAGASQAIIPEDASEVELQVDGRDVKLTNLGKPFWPELGITKGDLLRYYAEASPVLWCLT